jgi:tol-pal system protein YbgF|tara:strand:+ start:21697 stop:22404 length:708 start_codon:yes stop_codon:yes gene_type:complete
MKNTFYLFFIIFLSFQSSAQNKDDSLDLILEKLENLENELARLSNSIDSNSFEISKLDDANQARYVDLDKRIHELESIILISSDENNEEELERDNNLSNPLAELIEKDGEQEEFKLWSNTLKLIDNSRYSEASENLRLLIISYPDGSYLVDAYFWLAEIYFLQDMYDDAFETYQSLASNFPDHERMPVSLYKLGLISIKLENFEDAIAFFDRVILNYPKSGASVLSEQELLKINN